GERTPGELELAETGGIERVVGAVRGAVEVEREERFPGAVRRAERRPESALGKRAGAHRARDRMEHREAAGLAQRAVGDAAERADERRALQGLGACEIGRGAEQRETRGVSARVDDRMGFDLDPAAAPADGEPK